MSKPTITDAGDLLSVLNQVPAFRAVAYVGADAAICEYGSSSPTRPTSVIAWIDEDGTARELLDQAYDADCALDAHRWSALPLR